MEKTAFALLLESGHYEITARGKTYRTSPAAIAAGLEDVAASGWQHPHACLWL